MEPGKVSIQSYRDLEVWKAAVELVAEAYVLTRLLPDEERFGLMVQIRRSAVSIPSNIAEGHARDSTKEYLRFITIALGSVAELETQITIIERLGYIAPNQATGLVARAATVGKMLHRLMKSRG